jgi:hypothetical protein
MYLANEISGVWVYHHLHSALLSFLDLCLILSWTQSRISVRPNIFQETIVKNYVFSSLNSIFLKPYSSGS